MPYTYYNVKYMKKEKEVEMKKGRRENC